MTSPTPSWMVEYKNNHSPYKSLPAMSFSHIGGALQWIQHHHDTHHPNADLFHNEEHIRYHLQRTDIPLYLHEPQHGCIIGHGQYTLPASIIATAKERGMLPRLYMYRYYIHAKDTTLCTYKWWHHTPDIWGLHIEIEQTYRIIQQHDTIRMDAHEGARYKIKANHYPPLSSYKLFMYHPLHAPLTQHLIAHIQQRIQHMVHRSAHERMSMIRMIPDIIQPDIDAIIRPSYTMA